MPPELPYYAQTADFSCGPACVLMTLSGLGYQAPLTRETEFMLWRRTNLVGVPAADAFTIALPFVDRGLEVRVINERVPTFDRERVIDYANEEAAELTVWASDAAHAELARRNVPMESRAPTVEDVVAALEEGWVPLCMVGMQEVHDEEIPHWVLALAVEDDEIVFHDPYETTGGPRLRRPKKVFQAMLDDMDAMHLSRALVLVRQG